MVTKESFQSAVKKEQQWALFHKSGKEQLKHRISNVSNFLKTAFEIDIRLATIPSMILPMPKNRVNQLEKSIKALRQKRKP